VRYANDGKQLYVFGQQSLRVWDLGTLEEKKRFELRGRILAFTPDGRTYLRGGGEYLLCEAATGKLVRRIDLTFDGNMSSQAVFSRDGRRLAATDGGGNIFLVDVATGKTLHTFRKAAPKGLRQAGYGISALAFSADGDLLFAGETYGPIYRFDVHQKQELAPLAGHCSRVTKLILSPDGRRLYSTGYDQVIRRWDVRSGQEIALPDGYVGNVHRVSDGRRRQSATADLAGRVELVDPGLRRRLKTLQGTGPNATGLALSPDGALLASLHHDGVVRVWDTRTGQVKNSWKACPEQYREDTAPMWFSPDGRRLCTWSYRDQYLRQWDVAATKQLWECATVNYFGTFAVSPDGAVAAVGQWPPRSALILIDLGTGKLSLEPSFSGAGNQRRRLTALAFSPDGRFLAGGDDAGAIHVWKRTKNWEPRSLGKQTGPANALVFSVDGRYLAALGRDLSATLLEVETGQQCDHMPDYPSRLAANDKPFWTGYRPSPEELPRALRPPNVGAAKAMAAMWADLAGDAANAYRGQWWLADHPEQACVWLREQILPSPAPDAARLAKWVSDLGSDTFATRARAMKALGELGPVTRPALQTALGRADSLEMRRRLERLLEALDRPPTPESLRQVRAVQAMEWADTEPARELLRHWASGAPGTLLTDQARAALQRLGRSPQAPQKRVQFCIPPFSRFPFPFHSRPFSWGNSASAFSRRICRPIRRACSGVSSRRSTRSARTSARQRRVRTVAP
jgi:WD40 repeat protein